MTLTDVAVITGAASGVGKASAARFLNLGIAVIGLDRDECPADLDHQQLAWVQADVALEETWVKVLELAAARFGTSPGIFVANAAQLIVGSVTTLSDNEWKSVFDVNVFGAVRGMRACIPGMIERRRGAIVTVASVDAFMAEQGLAAYCSSKGALLQLTRCVAVDYARDGIRANCVCPGVIDTPFFRRHLESAADPERFLRARKERNPLGRLLQADEIASVVAFLASNDASAITGTYLTADAGLSASFDFRTGEEGA